MFFFLYINVQEKLFKIQHVLKSKPYCDDLSSVLTPSTKLYKVEQSYKE